MGKAVDIAGRRFGRLVVVEKAPTLRTDSRWHCRCDCGGQTVVTWQALKAGATKSCGCIRRENMSKQARERVARNRIAGALNGSTKTARTLRISNALADVFGKPADTVHVDRPGAKIIRGGRY